MRIGVIDLGSNTIRLVVFNWDGKKLEKKHNIKRQAQSVKYVQNAQMSQIGLDQIVTHLKELMVIARAYAIDDLKIFATASLRNIENSNEAKSYIENQIDMKIDILNGNQESLYGFDGMCRILDLPIEGLSVDIGGGSTEITYFKNEKAIHSISIPLGSLNLYLNHVDNILPSEGEQMLMRIDIRHQLDAIEWLKTIQVKTLIGIGGSSRALMRLHQAKYEINTSIIDMRVSRDIIKNYANLNGNEITNLTPLIVDILSDRLTTVIPGIIILHEIMKLIQAEEFMLSPYGVREGYIFNRILSPLYERSL